MRGFSQLLNRWTAVLHDLTWIPVAVFLAYGLRFNFEPMPLLYEQGMIHLLAIALPVQGFLFWFFGLYRGIWRFASIPDLLRILRAVGSGALMIVLFHFVIFRLEGVPRSVLLLYPILLTLGLGGPRTLYRWSKDHRLALSRKAKQQALIIGAGRAGELLIRDLLREGGYQPVAFVDDDPEKQGREIHGVRVLGTIDDLPRIIGDTGAEVALVAIPTARRTLLNKVVNLCTEQKVLCRTLPSLAKLADGQVVARLRPVTVEDLLRRDPVVLDQKAISAYLKGKRILVTGGGGSIGAELCRQIANLTPNMLVIFENSEFNLYRIDHEINAAFPDLPCHAVLGDVKDPVRVGWVFENFKPEVVFHAAAYKHVPMVEANPAEGVRNNVIGARTVADAAHRNGSDRFVMVSTDKAVNPTNIMGATKRAAEIICQSQDRRSETNYITTRFGNVLGSVGSVAPLFEKQIAAGGPVTVTDPDITRYFMTIPEAVRLILQAGAMGQGGEIFVLDMGEPVRIADLAEQMIRLSGLTPGEDIAIEYIGLRPGEKLHEELFHPQEGLRKSHHDKLLLANSRVRDWDWLTETIETMNAAALARDVDALFKGLKELIPEWEPKEDSEAADSLNRRLN